MSDKAKSDKTMSDKIMPDAMLSLPHGAPWLSTEKALMRNPKRFRDLSVDEKWRQSFLNDVTIPQRSEDRPVTRDNVPHQMYTQQSNEDVLAELVRKAKLLSQELGTVIAPTHLSFHSTQPAFYIPDHKAMTAGLSPHVREHAHIHAHWSAAQTPGSLHEGTGGGSMHVCLSFRDAEELIERNWAEWHPLADVSLPLILLYAPQTAEEIDLSLAVIKASYQFVVAK